MQDWFTAWLALPIPAIFASLFVFYLATATLLVCLSFRSPLSRHIQSLKGVVAPFFGAVAIIFGLLIAAPRQTADDRRCMPASSRSAHSRPQMRLVRPRYTTLAMQALL